MADPLSLRWLFLRNKGQVQAGRPFLCQFYKLDLYGLS